MQVVVSIEEFALAAPFVIARGSRLQSVVVVATLNAGAFRGRGECVPYARYGESVASVCAAIEAVRPAIEAGANRASLQGLLPAGAARNALDCAMWDLDAKRLGISAISMAGLHRLAPVVTAYTISLGTPQAMAASARANAARPLLKIKLGGDDDVSRIMAVRAAAPAATLIVDANEAWREANLDTNFAACEAAGVALIEQPLPAGADGALAHVKRTIPVCADESVHDRSTLAQLQNRYNAINIKLDKTGGLTEALLLARDAQLLGFGIFVGCMVGSSLAMAPAMLLTPQARFVDLDGPLLLAQDRADGLVYDGSVIQPPSAALWG